MDHFTVFPGDAYFTMNGKAVYEKATAAVPECVQQILRLNGLALEEDPLDDDLLTRPRLASSSASPRYSTSLIPNGRRTWSPTRTLPA